MNTLLLEPTDILFFRDGRPMSGSLTGHGAAWPLPMVANAALHAALHRADLEDVHGHDHHSKSGQKITDARKFGSLVTAGPFPVSPDGQWLFPRPLDAGTNTKKPTAITYQPFQPADHHPSSLPTPLKYPVVHQGEPCKDPIAPWWSKSAWQDYLKSPDDKAPPPRVHHDSDFSDAEQNIGIAIDRETGTQDGESFYSAHYLRLRENWRLGLLAEALDKINGNPAEKRDLIHDLFPTNGNAPQIIVGGQQRLCSVVCQISANNPLPVAPEISGTRVKWILFAPAIFPAINGHTGGWLPSWIDHESGQVHLLDGPGTNAAARRKVAIGKPIAATLVAAITGKPIPITGYALPHEAAATDGGPKPIYLAVPAGSIYYFECASEEAARTLAAALNWHGADTTPSTIRNRRSTLMGEKGFGLGICAPWELTQS